MATVLLVEPSATLGRLHAVELEQAGHVVEAVRSVDEAQHCLRTCDIDAVVSAVDMAPPGGYGFLRELRADARTSDLPFVFLSSHPADVVRAGAGRCWIDGVVTKGVPGAVPAAIRSALRPVEEQTDTRLEGTVLVVDDSAVTRAVIGASLEEAGLRVIEAADGASAIELAVSTAPDAVVLDFRMPGKDGMSVLAALRAAEPTAEVPVVILTADSRTATLVMALDAGAEDYISKSSDPRELVARLRRAMRRRQTTDVAARRQVELEVHASLDRLTGLVTRGQAELMLARLAQSATRSARPLALILIDLDHFKSVNDTYGHRAGDQVLSAVGGRILAGLRSGDVAARWGGEEILVAMPGAGLPVAQRRGEALRAIVADTPIPTDAGDLDVTASVGVSVFLGDCDLHVAISRADAALYEAKRDGRNRVVAAA